MAFRTGMAIITLLLIHMCRVLTTYRAAMDAVLTAAVTAGTITTLQKEVVDTHLNSAQTACNILRVVTGY